MREATNRELIRGRLSSGVVGELLLSARTALSAGVRVIGIVGAALVAGLLWTAPVGLILVLMGMVDVLVSRPWVFLWAGANLVAGIATLDRINARGRNA